MREGLVGLWEQLPHLIFDPQELLQEVQVGPNHSPVPIQHLFVGLLSTERELDEYGDGFSEFIEEGLSDYGFHLNEFVDGFSDDVDLIL